MQKAGSGSEQIPVFKPWLTNAEIHASKEALEMGWLGMGSYVAQFEAAIAALCECEDRHVCAVSTGHAAIHLGLLLMGVGPGDEVITPSFNNIADHQAILATGASPVFCDILPETLCIDPKSMESAIGPKTKAVIAMDYASQLCDHDEILSIAKSNGIQVFHDAAHSIGSNYKGALAGNVHDVTMFSFDPVKTITSIDGGALIVKTENDLNKLHELRLIGMSQKANMMYKNQRAWNYDVERLGFRYHLANIHAAIGITQIKRFDLIKKSRISLFKKYFNELKNIEGLILPLEDVDHMVPFIFAVRIKNGKRNEFIDFMKKNGIDSGIHWQPAHNFTLFRNFRKTNLSVTNVIGDEIVTIPFYSNMSDADSDKVISKIRSFFL